MAWNVSPTFCNILYNQLRQEVTRPYIHLWQEAGSIQALNKDDLADEDLEDTLSIPLSQKLSPFFNNSKLSDITLAVGPHIFHSHKLILCSWSPVFKEMLTKSSKTDELHHVVDETQECVDVFRDLLEFMYTETVQLSEDTVYPIHKLAKKYEVEELCDICEEFLITEVATSSTAFKLFNETKKLGITKVCEHCFTVLETHFEFLSDTSIQEISPSLFLRLLDSSDLVVRSEGALLQKAFSWLTADGRRGKYHKYTDDVLSRIRFANITPPSQLKIISCLVPSSLKIYDQFKRSLQKSLRDAFEWRALVACEEDFNRLPDHIKFTSFARNYAELRNYTSHQPKQYQRISLRESKFKDKHEILSTARETVPVNVVGMSANNTLSKEGSWSMAGSTYHDKVSKKWGIRYKIEPPHNQYMHKSFRMVTLTVLSRNQLIVGDPIVNTSKGVVQRGGVADVLSPEVTGLDEKPASVMVKVCIFVKMRFSDIMKGQLLTPADIIQKRMKAKAKHKSLQRANTKYNGIPIRLSDLPPKIPMFFSSDYDYWDAE